MRGKSKQHEEHNLVRFAVDKETSAPLGDAQEETQSHPRPTTNLLNSELLIDTADFPVRIIVPSKGLLVATPKAKV